MKISEYITKDNWGQGVAQCNGRYCAMGFIVESPVKFYLYKEQQECSVALRKVLRSRNYVNTSVVQFNDTKGRTYQEVKELFQEAGY